MNGIKILIIISVLFLVHGCASNQPSLEDKYPDLVTENPPDRIPYIEKEVTIDSTSLVKVQKQYALLIKGNFPNPCTQILRVDERTAPEVLFLDIIGWQKYQQTCAEAITPFTYIHRGFDPQNWNNLKKVVINDIEFEPLSAPKTE